MTTPQPFRQATPLRTQALLATCYAAPIVFAAEAIWPEELHADMAQHNGIPCEGLGEPEEWCADCRFGTIEEIDVP
jgi:hypothetical protein